MPKKEIMYSELLLFENTTSNVPIIVIVQPLRKNKFPAIRLIIPWINSRCFRLFSIINLFLSRDFVVFNPFIGDLNILSFFFNTNSSSI